MLALVITKSQPATCGGLEHPPAIMCRPYRAFCGASNTVLVIHRRNLRASQKVSIFDGFRRPWNCVFEIAIREGDKISLLVP